MMTEKLNFYQEAKRSRCHSSSEAASNSVSSEQLPRHSSDTHLINKRRESEEYPSVFDITSKRTEANESNVSLILFMCSKAVYLYVL